MPQKTPQLTSPPSDHQICVRCNEALPDEYFEGREYCMFCATPPLRAELVEEKSPSYLKNRQEYTAEVAARHLMAAVTRTAIEVPHTSEFAAAIVNKFPDRLNGIATMVHQVVNAIVRENPASAKSLNAMKLMHQIIRDSTIMRESAPDVNNVSDEALERELRGYIARGLENGTLSLPD